MADVTAPLGDLVADVTALLGDLVAGMTRRLGHFVRFLARGRVAGAVVGQRLFAIAFAALHWSAWLEEVSALAAPAATASRARAAWVKFSLHSSTCH